MTTTAPPRTIRSSEIGEGYAELAGFILMITKRTALAEILQLFQTGLTFLTRKASALAAEQKYNLALDVLCDVVKESLYRRFYLRNF